MESTGTAQAAEAVVTHAHGAPVDRTALVDVVARQRPHHQKHRIFPRHHRRVHELVESVGTGFLYGIIFGSVLAAIDGYRESPQHQKLRGIIHHGKHAVPETAGRIAIVTIAFRLASWGLEAVRGEQKPDLWDVLLAAPLAGALLRVREGPRVAARTALVFGSVGAVMIGVNIARMKITHHGDSPEEILEEIAFAEEIEE